MLNEGQREGEKLITPKFVSSQKCIIIYCIVHRIFEWSLIFQFCIWMSGCARTSSAIARSIDCRIYLVRYSADTEVTVKQHYRIEFP